MTWDDGPDNLLVYGTSATLGNQLLEIEPVGLPPVVKQKNPGSLYIPGTVYGLAVMDDPDDDDYGKEKTKNKIYFLQYLLISFPLSI